MKLRTPDWECLQSSAAQLSWSRTTRFRVFFAILVLSFLYTLATFIWESPDEWEDGAIPISYVDKNWEPYTPAEQLEDDPSACRSCCYCFAPALMPIL